MPVQQWVHPPFGLQVSPTGRPSCSLQLVERKTRTGNFTLDSNNWNIFFYRPDHQTNEISRIKPIECASSIETQSSSGERFVWMCGMAEITGKHTDCFKTQPVYGVARGEDSLVERRRERESLYRKRACKLQLVVRIFWVPLWPARIAEWGLIITGYF